MAEDAFDKYLSEINNAYLRGDATEHTHRPALKAMIEALGQKITATNEPRRQKCGAPDFIISRRLKGIDETVGYIETKDIGTNLTQEVKSEQIKKRYLASLHNFILTDYIEFRWYVNGEARITARLVEEQSGKFKLTEDGTVKVSELLGMFLSQEAEKITSAKELAARMAGIAKLMREIINKTFAQEEEEGTLHSQLQAFREVLIHDLTEEQFADMYAQTICYGLFSARCHIEDITLYGQDKYAAFHGMDDKSKELTRKNAAYLLPKTNPFLRRMFDDIAGINLDDRIAWLVDDLVTLLENSQMDLILHDFAKKLNRKDPVVHFYETFLAEYDPKLKKTRGVYYTPDEVVSYIVRSVDILLKEKFDLKRGLADDSKIKGTDLHKLLILDPAVGTGTFLFEVIDQIHDKFKTQKGAWSGYVKDNLLPRLFGFELMMAPYAVCHMKLGLQLAETGYDFSSDERLGVYLTNTLEEAEETSKNLFAQYLSQEARAANKVKKDLPIMVVLGNPPYSVSSQNQGEYIDRLMELYKKAVRGERNIQPLSDDYIKFIRFAHWRIEQTGAGIVAMITNHTFLSGLIHRGMREELLKSFDEIYVLDLHGNALTGLISSEGQEDQNVFDIRQGVSISVFVKTSQNKGQAQVKYAELWDRRNEKYKYLLKNNLNTTAWQKVEPTAPHFFFVPDNRDMKKDGDMDYGITNIMPVTKNGIQTGHDSFAVDFERPTLENRIKEFYDRSISNEDLRKKYALKDQAGWCLNSERQKAFSEGLNPDLFVKYFYRPFDMRNLYYSKRVLKRPVSDVMYHLLKYNLALITCRQQVQKGFRHVFVTRLIGDGNAISLKSREWNYYFPLYLYPYDKKEDLFEHSEWPVSKSDRIPNLSRDFVEEFAKKIRLDFVSDGFGDLDKTFGPEDIFHYIYAVFYSPGYRERYAEFLKIDFPRVPWPKGKKIFVELCKVGDELTNTNGPK